MVLGLSVVELCMFSLEVKSLDSSLAFLIRIQIRFLLRLGFRWTLILFGVLVEFRLVSRYFLRFVCLLFRIGDFGYWMLVG